MITVKKGGVLNCSMFSLLIASSSALSLPKFTLLPFPVPPVALMKARRNAARSPAASQPISPPQAPHPTFAQILPLPSTENQNLAPSNYIHPSSPSQQQQQTVQNNYKMNPVARQSQTSNRQLQLSNRN